MGKNLKSVGLDRKPMKFGNRIKKMTETARNCVVKLNRLTTKQIQQSMRSDHTNLTPDSKDDRKFPPTAVTFKYRTKISNESARKCVVKLNRLTETQLQQAVDGNLTKFKHDMKDERSGSSPILVRSKTNESKKIDDEKCSQDSDEIVRSAKRRRSTESNEIKKNRSTKPKHQQVERSGPSKILTRSKTDANKQLNDAQSADEINNVRRGKRRRSTESIDIRKNRSTKPKHQQDERSGPSKILMNSSKHEIIKNVNDSQKINAVRNVTGENSNEECRSIALNEFQIGDVVWAKLKGSPFWPAKVEKIYGLKNQMAEILWFNDYRRSKILKTQMKKFDSYFDIACLEFPKHVGLETAAREALIYSMNTK